MNVPIALTILGAGWLLIWTGLADPKGGLAGTLGPLLRGQGLPKSTKTPATAGGVVALAGGLTGAGGAIAAPGAGLDAVPSASASGTGASVVAFARAQLGELYVYAADGPTTWDCSGLTMRAYERIGIKLVHNAEAQRTAPNLMTTSSPSPGDLVYFGVPAPHCGIYIGGGQHIHAPRTGDVVKISSVSGTANGRRVTYRGPKTRKGTNSAMPSAVSP